MGYGALLWPRRTFRAFVRGRHCRNLFGERFEPLLDERVAALRARLGVDRAAPDATVVDAIAYGFWALVGITWMFVAPLAAVVAAVVWLT